MIALRGDTALSGAFEFDEMMQTQMLMALLPLAPNGQHAGGGPYPRAIRDDDVSQLQEWLQHQALPNVGRVIVHQAVHQRARERSYHPVRDQLDGLAKLGRDEARGYVALDLSRREQNAYTQAVGRMFLIAMIARIQRPGCKLDYMSILEGGQGDEKSKVCAILAGDAYFSDQLPDITSKDCFQHLRGKWLIEVSELRAYGRAQIDTSRSSSPARSRRIARPMDARMYTSRASASSSAPPTRIQYLRDETGNRRFWPVKTGVIKIDDLRRDRDQLLAEAVELFNDGEHWWPPRDFEKQHIAPEQEARFEPDPWEEPIAAYLAKRPRTLTAKPTTTILYIAVDVLGFDPSPVTAQGKTPISRRSPAFRAASAQC